MGGDWLEEETAKKLSETPIDSTSTFSRISQEVVRIDSIRTESCNSRRLNFLLLAGLPWDAVLERGYL